jgi:hypothetical protein
MYALHERRPSFVLVAVAKHLAGLNNGARQIVRDKNTGELFYIDVLSNTLTKIKAGQIVFNGVKANYDGVSKLTSLDGKPLIVGLGGSTYNRADFTVVDNSSLRYEREWHPVHKQPVNKKKGGSRRKTKRRH